MPVAVCLRVTYASPRLLASVLSTLVALNVELYAGGHATAPPWSLRWDPDLLEVCDAQGCRFADTSTLIDAAELQRAGVGSCGSLACAYAAWLMHVGVRDAHVELLQDDDPDAWHVVAWGGGRRYDPQEIGVM